MKISSHSSKKINPSPTTLLEVSRLMPPMKSICLVFHGLHWKLDLWSIQISAVCLLQVWSQFHVQIFFSAYRTTVGPLYLVQAFFMPILTYPKILKCKKKLADVFFTAIVKHIWMFTSEMKEIVQSKQQEIQHLLRVVLNFCTWLVVKFYCINSL